VQAKLPAGKRAEIEACLRAEAASLPAANPHAARAPAAQVKR
jgi:hypothetical protein